MARTSTNPTSVKTKAPTNYAKLADETELIRDGLAARVDKIDQHIAGLMADVPHRAAIMQSVGRRQNWAAQLYEVQARLDRYIGLRDRDQDGAEPSDS